jgi:thiosulfate/3-mercaptopyruvate sulfurtransferase
MRSHRHRVKLGFMRFTTLVDAASLRDLLQEHPRQLALLDCRFDLGNPDAGRQAYAEGHIPGARYADLNRNLAGPITAHSGRHPLPAPDRLLGFFASVGVEPDTQVVAYDDANGSFAARAWWLLRWLGHSQAAVLDGGYRAWVAAGGAIEAGQTPESGLGGTPTGKTPHPAAASDTSVTPSGLARAVTSLEVVEALQDPRRVLVDARAPERFAGTVEPIDSVAGHVPGAVNHPFSGNLDSQGRFLPAAELRQRWLKSLDGKDPAEVILMCGSGVTACHNALALEIAGLSGAKLYAGSWSEWIRDPKRPVARGAAR